MSWTRHWCTFLRAAGGCVLALVAVSTTASVARGQAKDAKGESVEAILKALPSGQRWAEHLTQDLMPFWMSEAARGHDGDFPTYRCNDGTLPSPDRLCRELQALSPKPGPDCATQQKDIVFAGREFLRAKSRQIFAYCVAFHVTGRPEYLSLAKEGVDWVRKNAIEKTGAAVSYWEQKNGRESPAPPALQRTSQDMAYALSGMGFYYYLTRDPSVLPDILRVKNYIFDTYYDKALDLFTWVKEGAAEDLKRKELVAQLDQVYGYMMLLTASLPEPERSKWKNDLVHLAHIMIQQFYSERLNLFFGAVTDAHVMRLETPHTDFGHSVKTMWLIYQIGHLTKDLSLTTWAAKRADRLLKLAALPDGTWARRPMLDGSIDKDKEWWILAELDQTAGTLALRDPMYARYLPRSYDYWFNTMVDKTGHEMWHWVNAKDNKPDPCYPKAHSWKNSLHSTEHALVSYITAQQLKGEPVTLYYAFVKDPAPGDMHPYFYQGKVEQGPTKTGESVRNLAVKKVVFSSIR